MAVRTVGGGESWDQYVGVSPPSVTGDPETIGEALASRDPDTQAVAGQDYQPLDVTMEMKVRRDGGGKGGERERESSKIVPSETNSVVSSGRKFEYPFIQLFVYDVNSKNYHYVLMFPNVFIIMYSCFVSYIIMYSCFKMLRHNVLILHNFAT